jgi:hypothetical protein
VNPKHPPGLPMTLGNMRGQGVQHLIAYCHSDTCRHQALIDLSSYSPDTGHWSGAAITSTNTTRGSTP